MHDYSILPTKTGFTATIYKISTKRIQAQQGGFRSDEAATQWAEAKVKTLDAAAQEFADDPITRHYGL